MLRKKRCGWLLVCVMASIVVVELFFTLLQSPDMLIPDSTFTGRIPRAFYIAEDLENDSNNWPDVARLESEIKYYIQNQTSRYKFPWNFALKDNRNSDCGKTYGNISTISEKSVTIIIGAGDSSLVQVLSSVMFLLHYTPKYLVKSIFVVADNHFSESEFEALDDLLIPLPFFRTFRLSRYTPDLEARAFATRFTDAEYIVMMDARIIVSHGWLEPLVLEVSQKYQNVMVPNVILSENEGPRDFNRSRRRRREIDWDLNLRWGPETRFEIYPLKPITQPAIFENLFLVSSKYFTEIGGFDHLRDGSGAEAVLWSIKTWLCKGQILKSPCSRVYESPFPTGHKQSITDLHKYKTYIAQTFLGKDASSYLCLQSVISQRTRSRKLAYSRANQIYQRSLKCDTFKTFIMKAQPQLISPPRKVEYFGRLKVVGSDMYVSINRRMNLDLVNNETQMSSDFSFDSGNLMRGRQCVGVRNNTQVVIETCNRNSYELWTYENKMLKKTSDTRLCITTVGGKTWQSSVSFVLLPCGQQKHIQKFEFSLRYSSKCKNPK